MKKMIAILLTLALCVSLCLSMTACDSGTDFTVGVCQLMEHESLDQATHAGGR